MNWNHYEQLLFDDACAAISEIAPKIAQETVLAFCFDCNSYDGTLIANINTEEGLARRVERYRKDASFAKYGDAELHAMIAESVGDFSRFNFAPTRFLFEPSVSDYLWSIEKREDFENEDAKDDALNAVRMQFMQSVARVVIRLQDEDRFALLRLSPDFVSFCNDHDEEISTGIERIANARKEAETQQ